MLEHDIASTLSWLGTPGRVILLNAPYDTCLRSKDLSTWLGCAQTFAARGSLSHCSLREGGPWAGVHEIFDALLPHLQKQAPVLLERHDYELAMILPRLRRNLAVHGLNLTDSAPDRERVRLYAAERATRIVHGLVDLLSAWKESYEPGLWVIACLDLDQAGPLVQRFFTELMRRGGRCAGISLLATSRSSSAGMLESRFPTGSVLSIPALGEPAEPVDPATMSARARALEEGVREDPIEWEIQAPHIIHAWLQSGEPERALKWQVEAFSIYTKQGLYVEALEYGEAVRRALEAHCARDEFKKMLLINKLCACYVSSGASQKALEIVEEGIARLEDPGPRSSLYYLLAMLHARFLPQRDLAKGEELLEQGLRDLEQADMDEEERHFQSVFNRNGLAMIRHFQGRYGEAIELCRQGFQRLDAHLQPDRHRLHRSVLLYNLAQVYAVLGEFEEAVAHFGAALEMDPNYSEYHNERGNALLRLGRCEEALADYLEAIRLSPPYFEVWTNLGQCDRRMGRMQEAVDAYSRALDLEPGQPLALLGRAQAYEALGRPDEALADYDASLALHPDQWDAVASRAVLHYEKGDLAASLGDLNRAIELAPEVANLYQNRALVLSDLGCLEEAARDLAAYLDLKPDAEDRAEVQERLQLLGDSRPAVCTDPTAWRRSTSP